MVVDTEDSAHGGKEKMAEMLKVTKKRGGGKLVRRAGEKILDSRRFDAQHHAELDALSEATATIQMPKVR
jgi:hypothetical protein